MITDEEIKWLLSQAKRITGPKGKQRTQRKSEQASYFVESVEGSYKFELYTRQNTIDQDHYSCGLIYHAADGTNIPLVRYNGSNHEHRNPLEGGELIRFQCHIHKATQRYMEMGDKAEKYAETTDRYTTLAGAFECLLLDCNIRRQEGNGDHGPQMRLI